MSAKRSELSRAVRVSLLMVVTLFLTFTVEILFPPVTRLGIVPRTESGLLGIAFSPLLHANAAHLLANAPPLLILLILLFSDRQYRPWTALGFVWLFSGVGTWLIGRGHSEHIGASSIIYGLAAYLIVSAIYMGSWRGWLVGIVVFLAYGGIFYGALPHPGPISWEGHLSGAIAGIWVARKHHA
jgi:membrane associated rhomboid family serine protease